jgi:hypothetical protein
MFLDWELIWTNGFMDMQQVCFLKKRALCLNNKNITQGTPWQMYLSQNLNTDNEWELHNLLDQSDRQLVIFSTEFCWLFKSDSLLETPWYSPEIWGFHGGEHSMYIKYIYIWAVFSNAVAMCAVIPLY